MIELLLRWQSGPLHEVQEAIRWGRVLPKSANHGDLRGIDLRKTNLARVDLSGVQLDFARLDDAWLEAANLEGASLRFAQGIRANLDQARMRGAVLSSANFFAARMIRADLSMADLGGCVLGLADLRGADLRGTQLASGDLENAVWWGAQRDRRGKRWTELVRSGVPAAFAEAFDLYMQALGLHRGEKLVAALEAVAWSARDLDGDLVRMLATDLGGWRSQLLSAATLALATDHTPSPALLDALWMQATTSWAAPQLVIAVYLLDREFVTRSSAALNAKSTSEKSSAALRSVTGQAPADHLTQRWLERAQKVATPAARARWLR
jgi:hypothetical protein